MYPIRAEKNEPMKVPTIAENNADNILCILWVIFFANYK